MANAHFPGRYWHRLDDGRIQCDICPRDCKLHDGQRGLCFVRKCEHEQIVLTTYGRSSGFCIDPIEKKPLNHFFSGSSVLSFGTAGCNLSCKFCQNWDISKSRVFDRLCDQADPESIANAACKHDCTSVAYTYNDPIVFLEYAVDTARACRERDIKNIAVTAGYMNPAARSEFFSNMDATNIDLKAFSNSFYHKLCAGALTPVLDTLKYVKHETDVWFEITTLLIPGQNDSDDELRSMCDWIAEHLGPDVPLHFTAFHPDWKMMHTQATPSSTLRRARRIGKHAGLHFVYTGNVHDRLGGTTFCPACDAKLIERDWYDILEYRLSDDGCCIFCGNTLVGHFGPFSNAFGPRRIPLNI